jgi:ADP-ribosylglycohydrolase
MLGALVGDAAGATLEFYRGEITEALARKAMNMPGGGVHMVGPGQITDDGELTITLYKALHSSTIGVSVNMNMNISMNLNLIHALAVHYARWYNSLPFDIGDTCSNAFTAAQDYVDGVIPSIRELLNIIDKENSGSEANGALMRASAIPAFINDVGGSLDMAVTISKLDARMSHPNMVCQEINAIYVHASYLLRHSYDISDTYGYISSITDPGTKSKILGWYNIALSCNIEELDCRQHQGHIKHAFILFIYFLKHRHISYEEAILLTLMRGGDTDTNAAIVGGIVSLYSHIPSYMSRPVFSFDCTRNENIRPAEYSVRALK